MRRHAPAAERNRGPIAAVLQRVLPARGTILEIASGTGQHVAHFSTVLPQLTWQPSDADPDALSSIAAWSAELGNVREPVHLDVHCRPWPIEPMEAIVCINMVHIAPWSACEALFAGAEQISRHRQGTPPPVLFLYGPYRFHGRHTAPSNEQFDRNLRARDPSWGVRDIDDLTVLGEQHGFRLVETVSMPANNHSLVFHHR